jgi:dihydropteroate synthase
MILRLRDRTFELGARPLLMGIVNATPDSFSDAGEQLTLDARVAHGVALLEAGADLLDVGGETASGLRPAVDAQAEIERVVPLIVRLTSEHGAVVSVDTYKPAVAEAAIAAGAVLVNDVSGLRDPALADVCAATGAGLVVMHTRVEPKGTLLDPGHYEDVVADVGAFLRERIEVAIAHGVAPEQLLLDPGPDFAKTPAQTVEVLRALGALDLPRPLLLAVSNKDFVGAITGRGARDRLAGTLAAVAAGVDGGAAVLRVHDVAAVSDFLRVRAVLRGEIELAPDEGLTSDRYPG